jgi:hypothetical protein
VGALWGVGDRAEEVLTRLGLRTVGDIAHVPEATLRRELGVAGAHLHALAWGRDERPVTPGREEKSVGAEETFPADVDDPEVIRKELLRLSGRTAQALRAAGCVARTVTVKLRLASFKTITRSRTLTDPTDVAREIYTVACALYEASGLDDRARLRLSASAPPGCARPRAPRGSWRSVTARRAGGKRSRPWTGSPGDSGPTRCARPHCSELLKKLVKALLTRVVQTPLPTCVIRRVIWEMNQLSNVR